MGSENRKRGRGLTLLEQEREAEQKLAGMLNDARQVTKDLTGVMEKIQELLDTDPRQQMENELRARLVKAEESYKDLGDRLDIIVNRSFVPKGNEPKVINHIIISGVVANSIEEARKVLERNSSYPIDKRDISPDSCAGCLTSIWIHQSLVNSTREYPEAGVLMACPSCAKILHNTSNNAEVKAITPKGVKV